MGEMARRTRNQGFAGYFGPVSGKLQREVVEIRSLTDGIPAPVREQVNARLNTIQKELDRVAGLENAALAAR